MSSRDQNPPGGLPLITVIIPVYNGAAFLPEAVACVRRQDYAPLEIIVVDDGSTDATGAVARGLGTDVVYVRQEHRGAAVARNRGLQEAQGALIAFLDADDLWPDGNLRYLAEILLQRPELDLVSGMSKVSYLPGARKGAYGVEDYPDGMPSSMLGAGLFRRTLFEQVGAFDETLRFGEDQDWNLRIREAGVQILGVRRVTHIYRLHANNTTGSARVSDLKLPNVLQRSLARRRKSGGVARPLRPWSEYYGPESPGEADPGP